MDDGLVPRNILFPASITTVIRGVDIRGDAICCSREEGLYCGHCRRVWRNSMDSEDL